VTATVPVICNETKTIDEDEGRDVADIVAVSPDGSETVNGTGAVSNTDWMPIPTDVNGRPFSVVVKPVQQCSHWKFSRVYFEVKDAYMFRIRVGRVFVTDWVSRHASVTDKKENGKW